MTSTKSTEGTGEDKTIQKDNMDTESSVERVDISREGSPELHQLFPELANDLHCTTLTTGGDPSGSGPNCDTIGTSELEQAKNPSFPLYDDIPDNLDDVINKAILSLDEFNESKPYDTNGSSEPGSLFDTPVSVSSVTDDEVNDKNSKSSKSYLDRSLKPNISTISIIKKSMVDTSKLISLFTTLKVTYLKLCKEFNYLLSKFNENEKVKLELINENNELKKLLMEIITERELDRKKFNLQLKQERKKRKLSC
jgi:hypothetical protein